MEPARRYHVTNLVIAATALSHAFWTWPPPAVAVLFLGGAAVAFIAEAAVVHLGLVEHAIEPQVAGIPASVILVWPGVAYWCLQVAFLFVEPGLTAILLAASVGTVVDLLTEPFALAAGVWAYPEHSLSSPRLAGVPWWNVVGWVVLVSVAASFPHLVGV